MRSAARSRGRFRRRRRRRDTQKCERPAPGREGTRLSCSARAEARSSRYAARRRFAMRPRAAGADRPMPAGAGTSVPPVEPVLPVLEQLEWQAAAGAVGTAAAMRATPPMMRAFLNICASCLPEHVTLEIVELL